MQQRFAILISAASLVITAACSQSDTGITTAVENEDGCRRHREGVGNQRGHAQSRGDAERHGWLTGGKERAALIARDTNGVTAVVDDIVVGPVPAATAGEKAEGKACDAKEEVEDAAHDAKVKTEDAARRQGCDRERRARRKGCDRERRRQDGRGDHRCGDHVRSEDEVLADPDVAGLKIDVDVQRRRHAEPGRSKSKAEMDKAMTVARNSKGVKRVVNHMKT